MIAEKAPKQIQRQLERKRKFYLDLDLIVVRWWDWGKASHICGPGLHGMLGF